MENRIKFLRDVLTLFFLLAGCAYLAVAYIEYWGSTDSKWILYSLHGWLFLMMVHLRLMEDR